MLEKHSFTHINSDAHDKSLKVNEARSILNMQKSRTGHSVGDKLEIIQGTSLVFNSDKSSNGTTIGTIEDRENRLLYYFVQSSPAAPAVPSHSIYEIDGNAETTTLIARTELFNFQLDKPVSGVVVDGMLIFTDDFNPMRYINIQHAKDGLYDFADESEINYQKPAPLYASWSLATQLADGEERLVRDSYKFSYRIVYFDNSKSRLAHFTKVAIADLTWDDGLTHFGYKVTANLPDINLDLVKKIEFILQRNNDPNFELFDTIDKKDITDNAPFVLFVKISTTTFIPSADITQTYENIPRTSTTVELKDNRLFFAGGESGYDDNGVDLAIGLAVSDEPSNKIHTVKNGGTYTVGIAYEDKWGWKSPILAESSISVPRIAIDSRDATRKLDITISGTAPLWAVRYNIMVKEEGAFEVYQTFPAYAMPAMKNTTNGTGTNNFSFLGDWQYRNAGADAGAEGARAIHLKMPVNIPFVVEEGMNVRFIDGQIVGTPIDVEYNIEQVVGDKIYIDNASQPVLWKDLEHKYLTIEVYRKQTVPDSLYHEIAIHDTCTNGVHDSTVKEWRGDQYLVDTSFFDRLNFVYSSDTESIDESEADLYGSSDFFKDAIQDVVETPAHAVGSEETLSISTSTETFNELFSNDNRVEKTITTNKGYSLNYEQIDNDLSVFVAIEGETKLINNEDVVLYSNIYTPGSLVNGLFNVGLLSEYRLGVESGRIIRLEDVGENTILSIHENTCNSLYIGRNVMKTGDNADLISLTGDVVGYHRRLKAQYGTQDIGSIVEIDGVVFFFDRYRRELIRYGNNGLVALSEGAEMTKYFEDIISNYNLNGNSYQIRAGYSRDHNQLFITFLGDINYTSVYDDRFQKITEYHTAYPEWQVSFGNRLIMFKGGDAWVWNDSVINMFFTEAYTPSVTFLVNQGAEIDWLFTNYIINSNKGWRMDISTADGESYTYDSELIEREKGKFYGNVMRDASESGAYPSGASPRFTGATMIGQTALVTLSRDNAEYVELTDVLFDKKERSGSVVKR